jgi:hypothetical protein
MLMATHREDGSAQKRHFNCAAAYSAWWREQSPPTE